MKKLIGIMLAVLTLLTLCAARAEELPMGEFVRLRDGDKISLWGDELAIRYTSGGDAGEFDYMLQVGDSEPVTGMVCTYDEAELFVLKCEYNVYFFIGGGVEDGMICYQVHEYKGGEFSEASHEFHYSDGKNDGELIRGTRYGSFFVEVYDVTPLGAFTHEQEYVIASSEEILDIKAVPAGMYAFGRIVGIRQDLPLLVSREGEETVMLHEGDSAIIVAGDSADWVYLAQVVEDEDQEWRAGWVRLVPGSYNAILVDGEEVPAHMYIDGILIGG